MNRIVRNREPEVLRVVRDRKLRLIADLPSPKARAAHLADYDVKDVKEQLYLDHHKKCAWCEQEAPYSSSPVEHFRPKRGAWRDVPELPRRTRPTSQPTSPDHYWWLTWTWENLLFSCGRCNDQGHKANYFPLIDAAVEAPAPDFVDGALAPGAFDLTVEAPLLLDPTEPAFDFLDHVRWWPSQRDLPRKRWTWSPVARTARGDATIRILKLSELGDRVQGHLLRAVLPSIEEIEQHLRDGRVEQARARWATLLESALRPSEPFTAATWCGLSEWLPDEARRPWGLSDPPRPASLVR